MGVANNFDFFNNFDFLNDAVEKLADAQALVDSAKEEILLLISQHNMMRQELFVQAMKKDRLGYCFKCKSFVNRNKITLVLTEGKEREESSYQGSCFDFSPFRRIYRVCEDCKEDLLSRDESYGSYNYQARDQSSFHVACIIRDIEIRKEDRPPLYPEIDEAMETRWNIPPLIQIETNNSQDQICYRKNDRFVLIPLFENIIVT